MFPRLQLHLGLRIASQHRPFSSSAELAEHTGDEGEDGASSGVVMEYLQSLGINVSTLEGFELPKQKSIIKERLDM